MVSRAHACVEGERLREIGRVVIPDVEIGIIGSRGEEAATSGPAAFMSVVGLAHGFTEPYLSALTHPV